MAPAIVLQNKIKEVFLKTIKMKCNDTGRNEVTKYIPICGATNPPEGHLNTIHEIERLEHRYNLHAGIKTNFLAATFGWALQRRYLEKFKDLYLAVNFLGYANQATNNRTKWNNLMRDLCKKVFPRGALEDQKDYLEETKRPGDVSPKIYIERVCMINK